MNEPTMAAPDDYRDQIAAAIRATWDGTSMHMDDAIRVETEAVMAVRDREMQRLRDERDRAKAALRHLMRATCGHDETEEEHVDRTTPDKVRSLVDAIADVLPDLEPAEQLDFVWAQYRLAHRVLNRRWNQLAAQVAEVEADLAQAEADRTEADEDGKRTEAVLASVREYVEHSDDDGVLTRETVLRILTGEAE